MVFERKYGLTTRDGLDPPATLAVADGGARLQRFARLRAIIYSPETERIYPSMLALISFLALVLAPTVAVVGYLGPIASREYVVETRFAVRRSQERAPDLIDASSILGKLGFSGNARGTYQDTLIAVEHIRGRDILENIGGAAFLEKLFSNPDVDWLSRMPTGLPLEKRWSYWKSMVAVSVDPQSSIATLTVRAFTPHDALTLAQTIIASSEKLLNSISERSENDASERAGVEVKAALERLAKARQALFEFRNRSMAVDPQKEAESIGEVMTKLTIEKLDIQNNISTLSHSLAEESPALRTQRAQLAAIDQQLASLQARLTDPTSRQTVSAHLQEYEQLTLNEKFSERLYNISEAALERARQELARQKLYLVMVVSPMLPEFPLYPKVTLTGFILFALLTMFWGMGCLIYASVKDHMV